MAAVHERAPTWSQPKSPIERRLRLLLPLGLAVVGAGVIVHNRLEENDRERLAAEGVEALLRKSATRTAAAPPSSVVPAAVAPAEAPEAAADDAGTEDELRTLTPALRAMRARWLCEKGDECPSRSTDHVIDSAATPAEREKLQALVSTIAADRVAPATPSGPLGMNEITFRSACREQIRNSLKNPRGARFEDGWFGPRVDVSHASSGALWLTSWVESTNSFGATIREPYRCTYDPTTRNVGVSFQ